MMLLDYFGVFGWIFGKMDEISKSGKFQGPTPRRRDPTHWLRGRLGQASVTSRRSKATLRHSYCSQHGNFCVLFCFVFPLLRGLVY